jgi:hypothetical protein
MGAVQKTWIDLGEEICGRREILKIISGLVEPVDLPAPYSMHRLRLETTAREAFGGVADPRDKPEGDGADGGSRPGNESGGASRAAVVRWPTCGDGYFSRPLAWASIV